jgi:crotonobetainyl-CoA:carnitine CoA-transferase CaiB-like acyl-CoA transferase
VQKVAQPPDNNQSNGPLAGIRVLDITSIVLGPLATQILADLGADVIKVEPLQGDLMRANGVSRNPGMSSIFLSLNRNKRSLALDLKSDSGASVLRDLLPRADVLVHNMRVPAIERLGFGYAAVTEIKPDIVYCVATGFDQDGPDRDKPAFDDVIQAACGLANLNSTALGSPQYVPSVIADKTTGMALVNAVLAALFCRERTGIGQYVEVPMFETMVAFMLTEHLAGLTFEPSIGGAGYSRLLDGGRKPAPTNDGYIAILPYTGSHWRAFFAEFGRNDLAEKYGTEDRSARNEQLVSMYAEMVALTVQRSTSELLSLCDKLDIPATPLYGLDDLLEHPQVKAVNLIGQAEHPSEGAIRYVRPTTKYSKTPTERVCHAPTLGQHTAEVLAEHGYSDADIRRLKSSGVIITQD